MNATLDRLQVVLNAHGQPARAADLGGGCYVAPCAVDAKIMDEIALAVGAKVQVMVKAGVSVVRIERQRNE